MKMKLVNPAFAGLKIATKDGVLEINKTGEVEVDSDDVAASLLRSGFKLHDQFSLDSEKAAKERAEATQAAKEKARREVEAAKEKVEKEKASKKAPAKKAPAKKATRKTVEK